MKYFVRILGIITFGITVFMALMFIMEPHPRMWEEWESWIALLMFVVTLGYLIGTKFGFKMHEKHTNIFYIVFSMFLFAMFVGGGYKIVSYSIECARCEKPITQTSVDINRETKLVTRYKDYCLKYTLTYPTNEREQNVSGKMYIQFYDKDGFVLAEMKISSLNYVTKHDENGEVTYLTANGSSGYLDINDYKAISSYSIITY